VRAREHPAKTDTRRDEARSQSSTLKVRTAPGANGVAPRRSWIAFSNASREGQASVASHSSECDGAGSARATTLALETSAATRAGYVERFTTRECLRSAKASVFLVVDDAPRFLGVHARRIAGSGSGTGGATRRSTGCTSAGTPGATYGCVGSVSLVRCRLRVAGQRAEEEQTLTAGSAEVWGVGGLPCGATPGRQADLSHVIAPSVLSGRDTPPTLPR
jgi:hypothetical protein